MVLSTLNTYFYAIKDYRSLSGRSKVHRNQKSFNGYFGYCRRKSVKMKLTTEISFRKRERSTPPLLGQGERLQKLRSCSTLAARGCPKRRVASGTMAGSPPQGMLPAAWQDVLGGNREYHQGRSSPQGRPEQPIPLPQRGVRKAEVEFFVLLWLRKLNNM